MHTSHKSRITVRDIKIWNTIAVTDATALSDTIHAPDTHREFLFSNMRSSWFSESIDVSAFDVCRYLSRGFHPRCSASIFVIYVSTYVRACTIIPLMPLVSATGSLLSKSMSARH